MSTVDSLSSGKSERSKHIAFWRVLNTVQSRKLGPTYSVQLPVKRNGKMKAAAKSLFASFFAASAGLLSAPLETHAASQPIVINEIQYHPANDDDRLQYIELHNPGASEVDLSGWKLRGVKFDFPANTKVAPGGFLIIARDLSRFRSVHGGTFPSIGNLGGRIKHGGEKLELVDDKNQIVESFTFSDDAPWPLGPDGYASTLERVCPTGPATDPSNWAPSNRATREGREGTPGRVNDSFSPQPLLTVEELKWEKLPAPGAAMPVSATIRGAKDPVRAVLTYYTFQLGVRSAQATNQLEMKRVSGSAMGGSYQATVPPQSKDTLVRFFITVSNGDGTERVYPAKNEPRPALASYVFSPPVGGRIPAATIINASRSRSSGNKMEPAREGVPEVGSSAFLYVTPEGKAELFDFVQVRVRSGGWKVHFLKDQLLDGMSGINLVSEGPPRWMLAEHLSYELYRRAGLNIQKSGHYRLNVDGRTQSYILFVEQPNKTFLARSGRNNEGNLYKIQWFHQDVVGAHEKKTNPGTGHEDVSTLIANLNKLKGEAQWKFIQEQFNVTNMINYFAVNMLVQNWDGFFNNYYAYHDTKPGGKWEMIPWDEDKTWGEYDGASSNYDWYEMPLTMGMKGDPAGRGGWGGGGPFGGSSGWWRPAGWFSGPLLANPQFRKLFLARIQELCQTEFTEQRFGPIIQGLGNRLREEAKAGGQNAQYLSRQLDRDIESFNRQLINRRKFLLKELEK